MGTYAKGRRKGGAARAWHGIGAAALGLALAASSGSASGQDAAGPVRPAAHQPDYAFWVGDAGPAGPIFSGPRQPFFICNVGQAAILGSPLVDNDQGVGHAVFAEPGNPKSRVLGWSETCGIRTRVDYFYFSDASGHTQPFDPVTMFFAPPFDMTYVTVKGARVPFVIRMETGTIDRFLYSILMLAPFREDPSAPAGLNNGAWNGKLVYYFFGGVGIGHRQGDAEWLTGLGSAERAFIPGVLARGFAVAASSGTDTGNHYDLRLAEEVMMMVKRHFTVTYGKPAYTVGIGGSGGAIQQYVIAQNHPSLLDAGIPVLSYPDMVTQITHIADCDLLEQYFMEDMRLHGSRDGLSGGTSLWADWGKRAWIEGLNTSGTHANKLARGAAIGSSECVESWLFAEPLVINPRATDPAYLPALDTFFFASKDKALNDWLRQINWSHWGDLRNIYGQIRDHASGTYYAPMTVDNVGVQYGLQALKAGKITTTEFLEINSCIAGWQDQLHYVAYPFIDEARGAVTGRDPFDSVNMRGHDAAKCRAYVAGAAGGAPDLRRAATRPDLGAMNAAYRSGQVFTGKLDIPVIDLRADVEERLDMHESRQSFSVRERLSRAGNQANQVIWIADASSSPQGLRADVDALLARLVSKALTVLDRYLTTKARPADFADACYDSTGALLYQGADAWSGVMNPGAEPGGCVRTGLFPVHSSSRMVAGDGFAGDTFKCALKPVAKALTDGTYGATQPFSAAEQTVLRGIFPGGVCDYTRPDRGRPAGFYSRRRE